MTEPEVSVSRPPSSCTEECRCPCHAEPKPIVFTFTNPEADSKVAEFIRRCLERRKGA